MSVSVCRAEFRVTWESREREIYVKHWRVTGWWQYMGLNFTVWYHSRWQHFERCTVWYIWSCTSVRYRWVVFLSLRIKWTSLRAYLGTVARAHLWTWNSLFLVEKGQELVWEEDSNQLGKAGLACTHSWNQTPGEELDSTFWEVAFFKESCQTDTVKQAKGELRMSGGGPCMSGLQLEEVFEHAGGGQDIESDMAMLQPPL